jgi:hypothetical protein
MVDWRKTIPLTTCPATECESRFAPTPITAKDHPELHARLERVANGRPYDYYHCGGWCKRIWRIQRCDRVSGGTYDEPQWIGHWDSGAAPNPVVFQQPKQIRIKREYLKGKTDSSWPARNKKDARHQ